MQVLVDELNRKEGVSNTSFTYDLFGFYWNMAPKTIMGVILNIIADRYSFEGDGITYSYYLFGPSVMHYLGQSFGSGLFIRIDTGLAVIEKSSSGDSAPGGGIGGGALAVGGWSFDFGGTRLLLNVNCAYRNIKGEVYSTLAFSVGGLF